MKRYRILKNIEGKYKIQVRGWSTLWLYEDLGRPIEYTWRIVDVLYFDNYEEAERCAIGYLKRKQTDYIKDIWKEVK